MRPRSGGRRARRRRRRLRRLSARRPEGAFELAVQALGRKERTTAELRAWLAGRGCEPADIDAAIGALIELGELDDARFARRFAEDKRELSGWGPERIRGALSDRGVEPGLIEAVLAADSGDIQVRRAAELLGRRAEALDTDSGRARALGYLTRRGYDYEIAYEAVRSAARDAA